MRLSKFDRVQATPDIEIDEVANNNSQFNDKGVRCSQAKGAAFRSLATQEIFQNKNVTSSDADIIEKSLFERVSEKYREKEKEFVFNSQNIAAGSLADAEEKDIHPEPSAKGNITDNTWTAKDPDKSDDDDGVDERI